MTRWRLETTAEFDRALRKLDKPVVGRVRAYLEELAELHDPRDRGRGLSANRAGYWRYRIGDYRIVAQIIDERVVFIALSIAHRPEIYRDR